MQRYPWHGAPLKITTEVQIVSTLTLVAADLLKSENTHTVLIFKTKGTSQSHVSVSVWQDGLPCRLLSGLCIFCQQWAICRGHPGLSATIKMFPHGGPQPRLAKKPLAHLALPRCQPCFVLLSPFYCSLLMTSHTRNGNRIKKSWKYIQIQGANCWHWYNRLFPV